MTNIPEHISINLGTGVGRDPISAKISISTTAPVDVGAGCTVYMFDNNQLNHVDILFSLPSETVGGLPTIERVRSHSDLSPLDLVCVDAIKLHFENKLPNEVFCKLEKLDPTAVKNLAVVTQVSEDLIDVKPTTGDNDDE